MTRNAKIVVAVALIVAGLALIGWNLRDTDAAFREQPKVETVLTTEQLPPAVQATVQRLIKSGGKIEEIQEERQGDEVDYEVDIIRGNTKTEYEISADGTITDQKSKELKR